LKEAGRKPDFRTAIFVSLMSTASPAGLEAGATSGTEGGRSSPAAAAPVAHTLRFVSAVCRRAAVEASGGGGLDCEGEVRARGYAWLPLYPAGWGAMCGGGPADAPERTGADACLRSILETLDSHASGARVRGTTPRIRATRDAQRARAGGRVRASLGQLQPGLGHSAVGLHITLPPSSPLPPEMGSVRALGSGWPRARPWPVGAV
jgi:hypothetical protein